MFSECDWIWGGAGDPDEYNDFKIDFTAYQDKNYMFYVSCDTDYALYNGDELLAFGQYADYIDYKVYDSVVLELPEGQCSLILRVWYQGANTQTYKIKPAGVIFRLTEDGITIASSGIHIPSRISAGYISHNRKVITSQIGYSFAYDASVSAGEFSPSHKVEGFSKELVERPVKKLVMRDPFNAEIVQSGEYILNGGENTGYKMLNARLSPASKHDGGRNGEMVLKASDKAEGVYAILDMGRETAGLLSFDITVDEPCEIAVGWGEHLLDGRVRTAIHDRDFTCLYRAVSGRNTFLHPFRRLGCRYLQVFISAKTVTVARASICETVYPTSKLPLENADFLRQRIYDVCADTLLQCMHEHYEDCPWREQALYTLDSRNQMLCGYYVFGETCFARACLELISHGLNDDGLLDLCYPAGIGQSIPVFSLVYFIQMREYLDFSGDTEFLSEKYRFLRKLMDTFITRAENGLIPIFDEGQWNFYEWEYKLYGNIKCRMQAPLNAFYSLALTALSVIAEKTENYADCAMYRGLAEQVNRAIAEEFYDKDSRLFRTFEMSAEENDAYSVLTNSLCLLCGAADGFDKENILKILMVNGAADTGFKITPNTLSMNSFRYDALLKENRDKFKNIILDDIDKTYFSMLCDGATTFLETALGAADFGGAGSLCHGWSALPSYYYKILL